MVLSVTILREELDAWLEYLSFTESYADTIPRRERVGWTPPPLADIYLRCELGNGERLGGDDNIGTSVFRCG